MKFNLRNNNATDINNNCGYVLTDTFFKNLKYFDMEFFENDYMLDNDIFNDDFNYEPLVIIRDIISYTKYIDIEDFTMLFINNVELDNDKDVERYLVEYCYNTDMQLENVEQLFKFVYECGNYWILNYIDIDVFKGLLQKMTEHNTKLWQFTTYYLCNIVLEGFKRIPYNVNPKFQLFLEDCLVYTQKDKEYIYDKLMELENIVNLKEFDNSYNPQKIASELLLQ